MPDLRETLRTYGAPLVAFALFVGVWSLAAVALALGFGPDRSTPAHRVQTLALGSAIAAFLVSVYLT